MPVQRTPWNRSFDHPLPPRDAPFAPLVAPVPAVETAAQPPAETPPSRGAARSRAGAAWVGVAVGATLMVLLIVFLLQNTAPVEVSFFGLEGSAPLAVALLIAGIGFTLVTLAVGTARIGQLRKRVRADDRDRRSALTAAPGTRPSRSATLS